MSHSRDGPGVTAPLPETSYLSLGIWNPPPSLGGCPPHNSQGESSTRSLKAPLKVPSKGPLNPPLKAPFKAPLNAPLKVSLKELFKVRPPSCTPHCALEGAPLVTLPLALPRMGET